jgi:hypothetical protein
VIPIKRIGVLRLRLELAIDRLSNDDTCRARFNKVSTELSFAVAAVVCYSYVIALLRARCDVLLQPRCDSLCYARASTSTDSECKMSTRDHMTECTGSKLHFKRHNTAHSKHVQLSQYT